MRNSLLRLNMGTMCVSVCMYVPVQTYIYMYLCTTFKWLFDCGPQSNRSKILQIAWCTKHGKVMFKGIRKLQRKLPDAQLLSWLTMFIITCPKTAFVLLESYDKTWGKPEDTMNLLLCSWNHQNTTFLLIWFYFFYFILFLFLPSYTCGPRYHLLVLLHQRLSWWAVSHLITR